MEYGTTIYFVRISVQFYSIFSLLEVSCHYFYSRLSNEREMKSNRERREGLLFKVALKAKNWNLLSVCNIFATAILILQQREDSVGMISSYVSSSGSSFSAAERWVQLMHQGSWFPSSFPNVFLAKRGARFLVTTPSCYCPENTKESQKIFQFLDNQLEKDPSLNLHSHTVFENYRKSRI